MQYEITKPQNLLNADGSLVAPGWARQPLIAYNKPFISHPPSKHKEWHYFFAGDDTYGLGFSVANLGFVHRFSMSFMDYRNGTQVNNGALCNPEDSIYQPPADSYGSFSFRNDHASYEYSGGKDRVTIRAEFRKFRGDETLKMDLVLDMPEGDTLFHAFPFPDEPGQFFYCHKMPCIRVSGTVSLGELEYRYNPDVAFAVQDWGRGVWPAYTNPYWGAGSGMVNGKPFGFNIGYEYGDVAAATENALFYDGRIHKLDDVVFHIQDNETAWMKTWTFASSDGRFEMEMEPVLDRHSMGTSIGPQHQVFGHFTGKVILDSGEKLTIDRMFGFAEKCVYRWENFQKPE